MQLLTLLLASFAVAATVDPCQVSYDTLDACQANVTIGPLVNDCIITTGTPAIPKTCTQAAYNAGVVPCVCPWLKANVACGLQYCGNFNLTCFKNLLNYTAFCFDASAATTSTPAWGSGLVLMVTAAISLVLL